MSSRASCRCLASTVPQNTPTNFPERAQGIVSSQAGRTFIVAPRHPRSFALWIHIKLPASLLSPYARARVPQPSSYPFYVARQLPSQDGRISFFNKFRKGIPPVSLATIICEQHRSRYLNKHHSSPGITEAPAVEDHVRLRPWSPPARLREAAVANAAGAGGVNGRWWSL